MHDGKTMRQAVTQYYTIVFFNRNTRMRNCVCIEHTHANMRNEHVKKSAFHIIYRTVKK